MQRLFDWQSRVWALGASLSAPIYAGGKLTAQYEQAKARWDELAAVFQSTVLQAIADVETAMTDIHLHAEASASQKSAVGFGARVLAPRAAAVRQGLISYLQVIDAERTLLTNELTEAQLLKPTLCVDRALLKALGGGWTRTPRPQHAIRTTPSDPTVTGRAAHDTLRTWETSCLRPKHRHSSQGAPSQISTRVSSVTFAEIGAGQEVARWFLQVGGASATSPSRSTPMK